MEVVNAFFSGGKIVDLKVGIELEYVLKKFGIDEVVFNYKYGNGVLFVHRNAF